MLLNIVVKVLDIMQEPDSSVGQRQVVGFSGCNLWPSRRIINWTGDAWSGACCPTR